MSYAELKAERQKWEDRKEDLQKMYSKNSSKLIDKLINNAQRQIIALQDIIDSNR